MTDTDGDSDSDTIDIHVGDTEVPAVSASVTPAAGRVPLDVAFSAEVVGGTEPYTFSWNFGDGSADSTDQNPSHTYDSVGVYTATVRVTDFDGDSSTATVDVSVLETASDLVVTDFSYDVTDVITYSVTITNDGPDATQNFYIDVYYDQAEAPTPGEFGQDVEFIADTIEPGASLTRTFTRLVEPLSQQAWAQVDSGELISDPDRTNNLEGPLDVVVDIVRINEVYFDNPGSDGDTAFVEIHATPGLDLSGYTIVGVNGSNGEAYSSFTLPADTVVPEDALLVVADGDAVENMDVSGLFNPQNGPDSIQLLDPTGAVVDAVAYGDFSDTEFPAGEGSPAALAPAGLTVGRGQDQPDTNNNEVDFLILAPTPGEHNHFANDACTDPFDLALNLASIGSTVGYTGDSITGGTTGCTEGIGDGPDAVFLLDLATATSVHLDTEGSDFDTVLYLRTTCDDVTTEVACDDDNGDGLTSSLDLDLEAGIYYVFVDGYFSSTDGVFILNYWTL